MVRGKGILQELRPACKPHALQVEELEWLLIGSGRCCHMVLAKETVVVKHFSRILQKHKVPRIDEDHVWHVRPVFEELVHEEPQPAHVPEVGAAGAAGRHDPPQPRQEPVDDVLPVHLEVAPASELGFQRGQRSVHVLLALAVDEEVEVQRGAPGKGQGRADPGQGLGPEGRPADGGDDADVDGLGLGGPGGLDQVSAGPQQLLPPLLAPGCDDQA
mmetsp:Transcript_114531/g.334865  ORF Transcript_114531/g.334865 Transcript_114531/m.334865 type:complete len:216 (-) Transcript_114531:621-1268(-)